MQIIYNVRGWKFFSQNANNPYANAPYAPPQSKTVLIEAFSTRNNTGR